LLTIGEKRGGREEGEKEGRPVLSAEEKNSWEALFTSFNHRRKEGKKGRILSEGRGNDHTATSGLVAKEKQSQERRRPLPTNEGKRGGGKKRGKGPLPLCRGKRPCAAIRETFYSLPRKKKEKGGALRNSAHFFGEGEGGRRNTCNEP